ncbi:hypothetical protein BESB_024440 [Besnoitia besnoiti]|uniref:Uncharacterized protein n=1 Tax=Besnoitia besnoiti TaxID=94643 RepID=A0A2A9M991_BESBE|nr:hypothetical protein BESB_024440 [Besnoitia besnoiti]PFH31952.1 hypothetical protein BESB_024440 [Besnoitia besnoiti]
MLTGSNRGALADLLFSKLTTECNSRPSSCRRPGGFPLGGVRGLLTDPTPPGRSLRDSSGAHKPSPSGDEAASASGVLSLQRKGGARLQERRSGGGVEPREPTRAHLGVETPLAADRATHAGTAEDAAREARFAPSSRRGERITNPPGQAPPGRLLRVDLESRRGRDFTRAFNASLRGRSWAELGGDRKPGRARLGNAHASKHEGKTAEEAGADLRRATCALTPDAVRPFAPSSGLEALHPNALPRSSQVAATAQPCSREGAEMRAGKEQLRLNSEQLGGRLGGDHEARETRVLHLEFPKTRGGARHAEGASCDRKLEDEGAAQVAALQPAQEAALQAAPGEPVCAETRTRDRDRVSWTRAGWATEREQAERMGRARRGGERDLAGGQAPTADRPADRRRRVQEAWDLAELGRLSGEEAEEAVVVMEVARVFKRSLKQLLAPPVQTRASPSTAAHAAAPSASGFASSSSLLQQLLALPPAGGGAASQAEEPSAQGKTPLLLRSTRPLLFAFLYQTQERQFAYARQQREGRGQERHPEETAVAPRAVRLGQRRLLKLEEELASLQREMQTQREAPKRRAPAEERGLQIEAETLMVPPIFAKQLEDVLVENMERFSLVDLHLLLSLASAQASFAVSRLPFPSAVRTLGGGGAGGGVSASRLEASFPPSGSSRPSCVVGSLPSPFALAEEPDVCDEGARKAPSQKAWLLDALLSPHLLSRAADVAGHRLKQLHTQRRKCGEELGRLRPLFSFEGESRPAAGEDREGPFPPRREKAAASQAVEKEGRRDPQEARGEPPAWPRLSTSLSGSSSPAAPVYPSLLGASHRARLEAAWRDDHRRDAKTVERLLLLFVTLHARVAAIAASSGTQAPSSLLSLAPPCSADLPPFTGVTPHTASAASLRPSASSASPPVEGESRPATVPPPRKSLASPALISAFLDSLLQLLQTRSPLSPARPPSPPSALRAASSSKNEAGAEKPGRPLQGAAQPREKARGDQHPRQKDGTYANRHACKHEMRKPPESQDADAPTLRDRPCDAPLGEAAKGEAAREEAKTTRATETRTRVTQEQQKPDSLQATAGLRDSAQGQCFLSSKSTNTQALDTSFLLHPSSLSRLLLAFLTPFFQLSLAATATSEAARRGASTTEERALSVCGALREQLEHQKAKMKEKDLQRLVETLLALRALQRPHPAAPSPSAGRLSESVLTSGASSAPDSISTYASGLNQGESTSSLSSLMGDSSLPLSSAAFPSSTSKVPSFCAPLSDSSISSCAPPSALSSSVVAAVAEGRGGTLSLTSLAPFGASATCGEVRAAEATHRPDAAEGAALPQETGGHLEQKGVEGERKRGESGANARVDARVWKELDDLLESLLAEILRRDKHLASGVSPPLLALALRFVDERAGLVETAHLRERRGEATEAAEEVQALGDRLEREDRDARLKEMQAALRGLQGGARRGEKSGNGGWGPPVASKPCGKEAENPAPASTAPELQAEADEKARHEELTKKETRTSASPSASSAYPPVPLSHAAVSGSAVPSSVLESGAPAAASTGDRLSILQPFAASLLPASMASQARSVYGASVRLGEPRLNRRRLQQALRVLEGFSTLTKKLETKRRERELFRELVTFLLTQERKETSERRLRGDTSLITVSSPPNLVKRGMEAFLRQKQGGRRVALSLQDSLLLSSCSLLFHLQLGKLAGARQGRGNCLRAAVGADVSRSEEWSRPACADSRQGLAQDRGEAGADATLAGRMGRRDVDGEGETRALLHRLRDADIPYVGSVGVIKELQRLLLLPPESWERHFASLSLIRLAQLLKVSGHHYAAIQAFLKQNEEVLIVPGEASAAESSLKGLNAEGLPAGVRPAARTGRRRSALSASAPFARGGAARDAAEEEVAEAGSEVKERRQLQASQDASEERAGACLQDRNVRRVPRLQAALTGASQAEAAAVEGREGDALGSLPAAASATRQADPVSFLSFAASPEGRLDAFLLTLLRVLLLQLYRLPARPSSASRASLPEESPRPPEPFFPSASSPAASLAPAPAAAEAPPTGASVFSVSPLSPSAALPGALSLLSADAELPLAPSPPSCVAAPAVPSVFHSVPQSAALAVSLLNALAILQQQLREAPADSFARRSDQGRGAVSLQCLVWKAAEDVVCMLLTGERLQKLSLLHFLRLAVASNSLFLAAAPPGAPMPPSADGQGHTAWSPQTEKSRRLGTESRASSAAEGLGGPETPGTADAPEGKREGDVRGHRGPSQGDAEAYERAFGTPRQAQGCPRTLLPSPRLRRHFLALAATAASLLQPRASGDSAAVSSARRTGTGSGDAGDASSREGDAPGRARDKLRSGDRAENARLTGTGRTEAESLARRSRREGAEGRQPDRPTAVSPSTAGGKTSKDLAPPLGVSCAIPATALAPLTRCFAEGYRHLRELSLQAKRWEVSGLRDREGGRPVGALLPALPSSASSPWHFGPELNGGRAEDGCLRSTLLSLRGEEMDMLTALEEAYEEVLLLLAAAAVRAHHRLAKGTHLKAIGQALLFSVASPAFLPFFAFVFSPSTGLSSRTNDRLHPGGGEAKFETALVPPGDVEAAATGLCLFLRYLARCRLEPSSALSSASLQALRSSGSPASSSFCVPESPSSSRSAISYAATAASSAVPFRPPHSAAAVLRKAVASTASASSLLGSSAQPRSDAPLPREGDARAPDSPPSAGHSAETWRSPASAGRGEGGSLASTRGRRRRAPWHGAGRARPSEENSLRRGSAGEARGAFDPGDESAAGLLRQLMNLFVDAAELAARQTDAPPGLTASQEGISGRERGRGERRVSEDETSDAHKPREDSVAGGRAGARERGRRRRTELYLQALRLLSEENVGNLFGRALAVPASHEESKEFADLKKRTIRALLRLAAPPLSP